MACQKASAWPFLTNRLTSEIALYEGEGWWAWFEDQPDPPHSRFWAINHCRNWPGDQPQAGPVGWHVERFERLVPSSEASSLWQRNQSHWTWSGKRLNQICRSIQWSQGYAIGLDKQRISSGPHDVPIHRRSSHQALEISSILWTSTHLHDNMSL